MAKPTKATKEFNSATGESDEEPQSVLVPSVRGKDGSGYDIFSQVLNETRTIIVNDQVGAGLAGVVIAQLKFLEAQDPNEEIQMIINSPGGSVVDGLAIYDVMRQVKCPIKTIGIGMQASMGSILLVGGDTRLMAANARLLVHQGSGGGDGTPTDLEIGRAFHSTLIEDLKGIYQDHTGLTKEYWGIVLNRDTWFSAEQAKKIGFIDGIVKLPETKTAPYAADRELTSEFNKAKERSISKYKTAAQIRSVINSPDTVPEEELARLRPELSVALAQFPEFWTAGKKQEKALEAAANDNAGKTAAKPRARKTATPKAS